MDSARKLMLLAADIEPEADPILWDILREGTERRWGVTRDVGKTLSEALLEIVVQLGDEQENAGREAMPEGVEWPRYEDGEPVRFGGDVSRHGEDFDANVITLYRDGSFSLNFWSYSKGERVKRPVVLAADGEPLEVGQTVWHRGGNAHGVVESIDAGSLMRTVRYRGEDGTEYRDAAKDLTHQRPVLDADGAPINEGETVFMKSNGRRGVVRGFDGAWALVEYDAQDVNGATMAVRTDGACLTHTEPEPEPPDSYCRLYSDMAGRNGNARTPNGISFGDFVRRCKALAERERS